MKTEVTWLACGILARVVVTIYDPKRRYTIAWLMGPDGEHCFSPYSLLGECATLGRDGLVYPDRCATTYEEALAFVRAELKDEWA